jgi:group I intron endonuclease
MRNPCGVYVIKCRVNGRVYVGSSINTQARLFSHKTLLARGTHRNPHLQAAWDKYEDEAFTFRVVERCEPKVRHKVEQRWITKLCAGGVRGFNIAHPVRQDAPSPRMSEVSRQSWGVKTTRLNRNAGIGHKWTDVEFRTRKLKDGAKARAALAEKRKDPAWRAAFAAKISATMKARAQTLEGKAQLLFASGVVHQHRREDPEFKAMCEAGLKKRKVVSNDIV